MADSRKVPIDIAYRKLPEALVDRKIVPAKWTEQHQQLRDALAILYPELPHSSDALVKFQAKTPTHDALTYCDCKALLTLLQTSPEGAQKNFFGQFTSPVIKKWTALVRLYEKNNVFAAEAARVVAQNTAFEIPFLKKTMQQNEKHVADNKRKILDLTKSIAEYKRQLEVSCLEIGIAGVHFREELQRLPAQLPSLFADVATQLTCVEMENALAYHAALQTYLHDCEPPVVTTPAVVPSTSGGKKDKKDNKKKKKDKSQDKDKAEVADVLVVAEPEEYPPFAFFTAIKELRDASEASANQQDFSAPVSLEFEAEAAEIEWDISMDGGGEADATIDWGIETMPSGTNSDDSGIHVDHDADAPVEIDWDISTEDVELSTDAAFTIGGESIVVELDLDKSSSDGVTRVGLLSDNEFRSRVLNDLLELKAFLRQRRDELADRTTTSMAFASQLQGSSPLLEHQSSDKLKTYETAVDQAIAQLTHKRLQQLVLIKNSERFLDRHVASLEMRTKHMDKCEREIKTLEDKNMDLIDATSRLQPQIDALVATTKKLKRELEAALPPLFKGYKVNIIGDVNNL